jgi:hypothetical protein
MDIVLGGPPYKWFTVFAPSYGPAIFLMENVQVSYQHLHHYRGGPVRNRKSLLTGNPKFGTLTTDLPLQLIIQDTLDRLTGQ